MPVGLFMAMAPKDPTNHGLTSRAEKVVVESKGANIAPLLACLLIPFSWVLDFIRDGTEVVGTRGASISAGKIFLRFREAWLSRESESEDPSEDPWEDRDEASWSESEFTFEPDASSDMCLIGTNLARAFCAAIICWQDSSLFCGSSTFFPLRAR
jgi:hypothetical protein